MSVARRRPRDGGRGWPAVGVSSKALKTASLRRAPVGDEPSVGLGVAVAAHGRDRGAGAVEVDVERDGPLVVAAARTARTPTGPCRGSVRPHSSRAQLLDDAGVADHDVHARATVDGVPGPAFDGRHRAAEHRVALDDLDVETLAGEVARGDQRVVAAADDDDVAGPGHLAESRKRIVQPRTRPPLPPPLCGLRHTTSTACLVRESPQSREGRTSWGARARRGAGRALSRCCR